MVFVVNEAGEKVATATAFYDICGIDQSGDGWLHWVAVRRDAQGKGLPKPLISHVILLIIVPDFFSSFESPLVFYDLLEEMRL